MFLKLKQNISKVTDISSAFRPTIPMPAPVRRKQAQQSTNNAKIVDAKSSNTRSRAKQTSAQGSRASSNKQVFLTTIIKYGAAFALLAFCVWQARQGYKGNASRPIPEFLKRKVPNKLFEPAAPSKSRPSAAVLSYEEVLQRKEAIRTAFKVCISPIEMPVT